MEKRGICCICGLRYNDWGNNPWPIVEEDEARCCISCDFRFVIPVRIRMMQAVDNATKEYNHAKTD